MLRHSSRRTAAIAVTNDSAPVELWCICQQPEGGRFMICCDVQGDGCKVWYHVDCVGLSKAQGKHMECNGETFICPECMSADVLSTNGVATPSSSAVQLPSYCVLSAPSFMWSDVEGADFVQQISSAYDTVVHWKRNLFLVPFGKVGKAFVQELARLFTAYGEGGALECIAIKAAMVMCSLLLQRPHRSAKARDFIASLAHCLDLWGKGEIQELLREGQVIQWRLATGRAHTNVFKVGDISCHFASRMLRGDVKAAIALLDSDDHSGAPMGLDTPLVSENPSWTVCDELLKKYPKGQPAHSAALKSLDGCSERFHPVIFEALDGALICNAALRTRGAAGPSGLDAFGWRRLCTSFQQASDDLCCSLALVARKLCTSCVDPDGIIALVACRLIALDKFPGVRPIGVGEVVRRIITKAVLSIVKLDVLEVAGSLQLCAGQDAGNEAAVHAMRAIFCDDSTEAVLLVDASNAFNCLNRQVALHNIQTLCPPLANILINTYRKNVPLFIDGRHIFSSEGTRVTPWQWPCTQ